MRVLWRLVVAVAVVAACTSPAASSALASPVAATSASPAARPRVMSDAVVWAEVRAGLPPGTPVAMPTWLPATLDRDHVELRDLRADPADPRYIVAYLAGAREIVLALGQVPQIAGSGYGMRVRGVPATLTFPISLWSDAATPAMRRVRWIERGRVLSISSDTFTGDDLLHVAWSLDPTTQLAPRTPTRGSLKARARKLVAHRKTPCAHCWRSPAGTSAMRCSTASRTNTSAKPARASARCGQSCRRRPSATRSRSRSRADARSSRRRGLSQPTQAARGALGLPASSISGSNPAGGGSTRSTAHRSVRRPRRVPSTAPGSTPTPAS